MATLLGHTQTRSLDWGRGSKAGAEAPKLEQREEEGGAQAAHGLQAGQELTYTAGPGPCTRAAPCPGSLQQTRR